MYTRALALIFTYIFLSIFSWSASAKLCNPFEEKCWLKSNSSASPAYPSKNSQIRINPSAVPVEKGFGVEAIAFQGGVDFALIKGLGRVGAAVSPSNGEETFFGPPALVSDADYLLRMQEKKKYNSQKIALATAFSVYSNKRDGLKRLNLSLGIIGKYNQLTKGISPGAGVSLVGGPFTLGYSIAQDEHYLDENTKQRYRTDTASVGIFLSSVAIDYSVLKLHYDQETAPITVTLLTGSLLLKRWILSIAGRQEQSPRGAYDFQRKTLVSEEFKHETFASVQYAITPTVLVGVFHNYYLLREFSAGLTLFF